MPQWCPGTRTSSPGLIQGLPHTRGYSGCTKHHHCLPMSLSWTRLSRDLPPSPVRVGNEGWRSKGQLSHSSHCQTLPACGYFTRHCMASQSCEGWDLPVRGSKSHQRCPCPGKPSCSERCPFGCCSPQLPTSCRVPKPTHALWLLPEEADETTARRNIFCLFWSGTGTTLASMWRKDAGPRYVSGCACSLPCTYFLFLD